MTTLSTFLCTRVQFPLRTHSLECNCSVVNSSPSPFRPSTVRKYLGTATWAVKVQLSAGPAHGGRGERPMGVLCPVRGPLPPAPAERLCFRAVRNVTESQRLGFPGLGLPASAVGRRAHLMAPGAWRGRRWPF